MSGKWIGASSIALACVLSAAQPAEAQYPEEPIKVIVPFAAGGMSDGMARLFQRTFEEHDLLPQPLTVVNQGGGGGTIGTRATMESDADGYTITIIHLAMLSAHALDVADFGHEAFEPIAQTGSACLVIATTTDSPYENLNDLVEAAKERPGEITEAVNIGAVVHIASLVLSEAAGGTEFRYVQSGGGAKRIQDLVGGHVETAMFSTSEFANYEEMGIRGLALLAPERNPALPNVPTAKEQGVDVTFCVDNWWFAPAGTPEARIEVLADAFEEAMETDMVQAALEDRVMAPTFLRGDELEAHIESVNAEIVDAAEKAK